MCALVMLPNLLALGFGSPWLLAMLVAAAAPWLVHLRNRPHQQEVRWAAVRFLLAARERQARRLRMQQWLLLTLRTLLVVFVVLAMARPYLGHSVSEAGGGGVHRIILLDDSPSMDVALDEASPWQQAQLEIGWSVGRASPGDRVTLLTTSSPQPLAVSHPFESRAGWLQTLRSQQISHRRADLDESCRNVLRLLDDDGKAVLPAEVSIVSDMCSHTWDEALDAQLSGGAPGRGMAELAARADLNIVDVGSSSGDNVVVTDVQTPSSFLTIGQEIQFSATVSNFSDRGVTDCPIVFAVDGDAHHESRADVPPLGTTTVFFSHRFSEPGSHLISAHSARAAVPVAETRSLAVRVHDRLKVLCVAGKPSAADNVALALAPNRDLAAIRPVVVSSGELADMVASHFDCVFLCNVSRITGEEQEILAQHLERGGGLVVFLGDLVDSSNYNRLMRPLLPATLGPVMEASGAALDPRGYRHPIVAAFRDRPQSGLLTSPIAHYVQLAVSDERKSDVALALPSGDPLIVVRSAGLGRSVLVATDATMTSVDRASGDPWTTISAWPSFVPLVREMLAYTLSPSTTRYSVHVGAILSGPLAETSKRPIVERPDGRSDMAEVDSAAAAPSWSYDRSDRQGAYRVSNVEATPLLFAVNVEPREADLLRVPTEKWTALFSKRSVAPRASHSGELTGIWTSGIVGLLGLTLLVALAETFACWQFGKGAT